MQFKQLHPNFQKPTRGTDFAGAYDLYMPTAGTVNQHDVPGEGLLVGLGFAAAVPVGFVALILPRSGAGAKHGVELRNTVGVIDADYRGEWMVKVAQREGKEFGWAEGERLFQYILVPAAQFDPELVDELPPTNRGEGGFGSTGA
ncbi:MAG: dUTP diphosphatase [Paracoccus denitrificans]|uniref:dUTP diphosphatase n=1 Tax=Paracoccus denitrificans TaxID=266 RepID=A0A533I0I8_PARDE|nr:MAG: dUTP diphosphatase [Paracoccus denitrificans]